MSMTLTRLNPFSADFVELDASTVVQTQDAHLPHPARESVGVVVTGDNHLSAYLPRLSPTRRAERRAHLRAGFEAAVTYAIEHHAKLFLQLGDLFDTPTPSNEDRAIVAASLARLRGAGIVCAGIGGNHDTPRMLTEHGGEAPQRVYQALDSLYYFPRNDALVPRVFTLGGLRLAVTGLTNNPVAPPGSDPLAGVSLDDPDGVIAGADLGLVMLHAGLEGLCRPTEGERIVTRASLEALPPLFRVIVAGHIHRFARERIGTRTAIVCGATERMEFGAEAGSSGFVWLELDRTGAQRVEHVKVAEQPRADLMIPSSQLWPAHLPHAIPEHETETETLLDVAGSAPVPFATAVDPAATRWQSHVTPDEDGPLPIIRRQLATICTPETMVRLRLCGPLTLEQYHQLALRDVLLYGQQHAFSFDLDTTGLALLEPDTTPRHTVEDAGSLSPLYEVAQLLAERLSLDQAAATEWADDQRAAAELLSERLRAAADREAGQ